MTKTRLTKVLSLILCMVLTAAMTLFTIGCSDDSADNKETPVAGSAQTNEASQSQETTGDNETTALEAATDSNVIGKGETTFSFSVTDANGKETAFTINTDKKTVGEALLELNLIAGEQGDYGLYVKTVNGITVDYDKDGKYWAFYINGEYAMTGVDSTDITEGATYTFKVE